MPEGTDYFALDPTAVSEEPGRFVEVEADLPLVQFAEGLSFRPVLGTNVLVNWVRFDPHTEAPVHAHDEEQMTIVLDGELEFDIAGETRTLTRGQVAVIPPNVPHGAHTRDKACLEIDVFSPPRKALLKLLEKQVPPSG